MVYRLKKDLGSLKKGTQLNFLNGVFTANGASFDPMDVIGDTDTFEEIVAHEFNSEQNLSFQTV